MGVRAHIHLCHISTIPPVDIDDPWSNPTLYLPCGSPRFTIVGVREIVMFSLGTSSVMVIIISWWFALVPISFGCLSLVRPSHLLSRVFGIADLEQYEIIPDIVGFRFRFFLDLSDLDIIANGLLSFPASRCPCMF